MGMRMKVILEVTSQEQIKAIMDVLDIKKDVQIIQKTEEYKAPEMRPLYPETSKELKKKEDIADIKAAYYANKAKKKEEKISEQIAEAQQRMDPEKALTEAAGKKKRGRPKGSSWQQSAEKIVRAVDEDGKSFSQIGREMGCSYKTISTIYNRAKENEL